ncbi:MAG: alcohol dehydrogenase catalytic domain-containing protein, partial [Bdellovibrionia bacterium]
MGERKEFELVFVSGRGFVRKALPPAPEPTPTEAVVRPKYVGICGSDLFLLESLGRKTGELRLGHEWIGVVERAGKKSKLKRGDVVTSTGTLSCLTCDFCKRAETHFCSDAEYLSSDSIG